MPFRVAISGLRASAQELNVIGNNIANANTTGFKQSRAEFADVYAVTSTGITANTAGAGVRTTRIAQQFTQGNIGFTDNGLDLAINGQGFFVVDDSGSRLYTRAGAFAVDREGFIVNAQNQRLISYAADGNGNITAATGPMRIDLSDLAPQATTSVRAAFNLDASAAVPALAFDVNDASTYNSATSVTVYDSLGNAHLATMYFVKTGDNTWETRSFINGDAVGGAQAMEFSSTGALITPAGGTLTLPAYTPPGGAGPLNLTLDYSAATQYGSPFGVNALVQDGFTTGRISGLDIDGEGIIFARFTNGQSRVQGQVALANFANPQGLQPVGDTAWAETFASGSVLMGAPGSSNLGLLQSGALEESNVELSEQLVKMIIAQRGFQANAEVISTADSITQTVINIR